VTGRRENGHHGAMSSNAHRLDPASPRKVDCVVVGGGAGGLSAAINMARMRRSVLLVDARDRFHWRHTVSNYLGFPDGIPAAEIRKLGWRQAARFGVGLLIGKVARATKSGDVFRVTVDRLPEGGEWGHDTSPRDPEMARLFEVVPEPGPLEVEARSVILATGVLGHFPDFAGRDDCVGISLFWCIHCDGYESIDRLVAVVGHDEEAVETALDMLEFTGRVTLVAGRTEGFEVPASRVADLGANGVAAYPCAVAEYVHDDGQLRELVLDDPARTRLPVEHVYTVCRSTASNGLARQLGVALDRHGQIVVNPSQETNVPGVYAAGDVTSLHNHQLSAAVHEGNEAACAANYYLYRPVQKVPHDAV
jgi:thioredoxin reductase (NADPH)